MSEWREDDVKAVVGREGDGGERDAEKPGDEPPKRGFSGRGELR
jgi:hypothetical protein